MRARALRILAGMSALSPQPSPYTLTTSAQQAVVITDIDMSIAAMARFMVKWIIATIPALIILWLLLLAVGLVMALLFSGIFHGLGGPLFPRT